MCVCICGWMFDSYFRDFNIVLFVLHFSIYCKENFRKKNKILLLYYFINSSTFFDARFNVLIHKFIVSSVSARHLSDFGTA